MFSIVTAAVIQPVKAQLSSSEANLAETVIFHETFDPPGDDSPRRTSGLGSRDGGRCALEEQPVQTLMPESNFGLTFAERPTVTVQLPENTSAQRLILTVTDEEGLYYAEEDFWVADQTGVVSLSLSDQAQPLTIGRNYRWHVVVVCDEQPDPDNPVLVGWVQRVAETVLEPQSTPLKQAQWLAKHGYWYDMLAVIMGELKDRPNDPHLQTIWQSVVLSPMQE
ncbi:DUF928 domain-containing protein [Leptolyngbya cf. ectocarpi LEGE 11479]|uniref:DUF928 domain-containing protein n=1 Tax=Leptolyngbya cf. ectocarpi LEGE 11479 TaxID=1828722 RepID=A0A928ZVN8_LEPEC|nr:DUF928 domain-containing protein [Leptolyngbya ectocarpi]MBE9068329.1 DUF928 domain-containing protein [Leptolyngbya cf. ectocarpi LEGE 11479]